MRLDLFPAGEDIVAVLTGGEKPHVGCAVASVPRPSLSGNGQNSCTSSVINLTGHKDEFLCRRIAESLCVHYCVTVICTGGVHLDSITEEQITMIKDSVSDLIEQIIF
ncbi:MAG: hypothetical protein II914_08715 [Clostridia bacterium]|nr:hypothetical protein [Clostridia bacterium]